MERSLMEFSSCRPIWEHEANAKGGKLEITWERRNNKPTEVDKWWLDTVNINSREIVCCFCFSVKCDYFICGLCVCLQMLLLIGEAFEETDQINGVVVNIRKMEKICEWN